MKISIVTISFNQRAYLQKTMDSVLGQGYPELEYIVVDPGSTDGSRELISSYKDRISKVVFEPDRGAADGLNKGFAAATGDIFGFVNSDDVLLPGAISSAAKFFDSHHDVDVVSGHSNLIGPDDRFFRRMFSNRMSINKFIYGGVLIIQPSTFFRRSIFERAGGFNANNGIAWDSELFLQMARAGGRFEVVNEFWSGYRLHPQSITGTTSSEKRINENVAEMIRIVKGRPARGYDKLLRMGCCTLRHLSHPVSAWERIRRGPVFGRSLDR
jgi:glycosyltransferase involved in cell wall biosynthesis